MLNGVEDVIARYGQPDYAFGPFKLDEEEKKDCECDDIVEQLGYETIDPDNVVFFRGLETAE
jgi:hypothetical protein